MKMDRFAEECEKSLQKLQILLWIIVDNPVNKKLINVSILYILINKNIQYKNVIADIGNHKYINIYIHT